MHRFVAKNGFKALSVTPLTRNEIHFNLLLSFKTFDQYNCSLMFVFQK